MTKSAVEPSRGGDAPGGDSGLQGAWRALVTRFSGPTASFHLVLGITLLLVSIGLVMVQSSSSVRAFAETSSPYYYLIRQGILVAVGLVAFYCALRIRFTTLKRLVTPFLIVALVLLGAVLIPGIGSEVNGSRGWIQLGGFAVQPAEIGRLAVILWVASVLAPRIRTASLRDYFWPAAIAPVLVGGLVLVAPDMGMATAIVLAYVVLIFLAGFPWKPLLAFLSLLAVAFVVFASMFAYRMSRVQVYFDTLKGNLEETGAAGYQTYQGMMSLAEGGIFGQGLGQSSAKWYYLPEASNDFIFAIIGEELGWIGATFVVALYVGLAMVGVRIAMRSVDSFRRLVAGAVATTISLQAFINIGYVVGLLPVTGIQLPLISYGGSSAVVTLASLGLLANCARHEPEAISDYQSRVGGKRHWWSLPAPQPYTPEPLVKPAGQPGRSSASGRRYGEPVQSPRARYESVPVVRQGQMNRAMTGRTSRPAREHERRRETMRGAPQRRSPQPQDSRVSERRGQLRSVPRNGDATSTASRQARSKRQGTQPQRGGQRGYRARGNG